jgi:Mlc titration factor MtfA (ptsG expression regulator)/transglutaminase-like putative cysteine protease
MNRARTAGLPRSDVERALRLPLAAFAGAVLLHVDRAPLWCSVIAGLALLWRIAVARGRLPLPATAPRIAITLGLAAWTLLRFRTLNGLEAGSALLVVMGAVKLLETRHRRDGAILIGAALFLLVAAALDRQSLPRLPLYVMETWLVCAAFIALGTQAAGDAPRLALRAAGRTLLLAIPVAVLAFLLFPRLPGALWTLPGSVRGTTGLSEEMSPGSISELAVSEDIAFRASFDGAPPPRAQRYWRGPVLHDFDGYTWRRLPQQNAVPQPLQFLGTPVHYRVTLEPSGQNWWFALDTVAQSPSPRVLLGFDRQLLAARPVTQTVTYEATSYVETRSDGPLSTLARRMDLKLPARRNPRSIAFAQSLRQAHPDDADFAAAVLDHFRRGGFQYTLTPPRLDLDSVDDLLFNTRLGFCGHFASAYTTLLRAGGVPARVVTGYLGGEWNAIGGYYAVRQSEAHAWTEIWLEGRGWTRVDPTAVVAPDRLERGMRDLLPDEASVLFRYARGNPLLRDLWQAWDAGSQWWQVQVVGFNQRAQRSLLERLGLPDADYGTLTLLLATGTGLWIAIVLWQLRRPRPARPLDPLAGAWRDLRRTLDLAGVPDLATAGPLDLSRQAAAAFPDLAAGLDAIAGDYARLRYADAAPDDPGTRDVVARIRRLLPRIRRRHALQAQPGLPPAAIADVRRMLPLYLRMPVPLRLRASAVARQFLRQVRFEGCGGLLLTDAMRHVIAFQAGLLVASRGFTPYRSLRSVLVYPDEFVVQQRLEDDAGVVTEGSDALSGQTEDSSRILLSWADIERGFAGDEAYNVVLHEFAHLLDHVVGGDLSRRPGSSDSSWHDVLEVEYDALCDAVDAGEDTLIDPYGAEDPAEFFAVCTEVFFERPGALQARHADLHAVLVSFYGTDPAAWSAAQPTVAREGSFTR